MSDKNPHGKIVIVSFLSLTIHEIDQDLVWSRKWTTYMKWNSFEKSNKYYNIIKIMRIIELGIYI